jgi:hypothetical protein
METDVQTAKPEIRAQLEASTTPAPQVVARVAAVLGDRITCYIVDVKDARTLARWQHKGDVPAAAARRLQGALRAILMLSQQYRPEQIASWFTWLNDLLEDRSPASALRSATSDEAIEDQARAIVAAARAHLAGE